MRPRIFPKLSSLMLTALLSLPATLMAQTRGVAFGGDYNNSGTGTLNAQLTSPTQNTGDFDFDGIADDARYLLPITNNYRVPLVIAPNPGITGVTFNIYAGYQAVYADYNSTVIATVGAPANYKHRFNGTGADTLQASIPNPITGQGGTVSVVFAPNSVKADFLNNFNTVSKVGFLDAAASVTFDVSKFPNSSGTPVGTSFARAMVKSGANWYVSNTATSTAGVFSLNGFTETWYPYNPATNLVFNASSPGTAVAGSTINNIQAYGVLCQVSGVPNAAGVASAEFLVRGFTADFVDVPPPPPVPTTPVVVLNTQRFTTLISAPGSAAVETFDFEVPEAPNRKLVVTYHNELVSGVVVSGIKYGGVPLTLAAAASPAGAQAAQIWYLDDPAVGTASLEVTHPGTDGSGFLISASTLANAADGVSVFVNGSQVSSASTTSTYALNLTTVSKDTIVFGAYNANGTGALSIEPYPVGQRVATGNSGSAYASAGYTQVETPAAVTYSWVRGVEVMLESAVLVGFAAAGELPAVTNSPITIWNTSENFENSGTKSTNTIEDFEVDLNSFRKLVVTIVDENPSATTSVTYAGIPLTLAKGELNNSEIWYLDNPPVGVADVVATFGSVSNSRIGAISLVGAAPGVVATSKANGTGVTANLNINRATTNTMVVGSYYSDDAAVAVASSPLWSDVIMQGDAGESNSNAGVNSFVYPDVTSLTWVNASSATFRAVAVTFEPVVGFTAAENPGLFAFRIPPITVVPTIDGTISPNEWADAFELPMVYPDITVFPNIGNISLTANKGDGPSTATDATESDISAKVRYKWDADFLYVLFDVKDDSFIPLVLAEGSVLGDRAGSAIPGDHVLLSIDPDVTNNPAEDAIFVAEFFLDSLGRSNYNLREELATFNPALGNFANHQYAVTQISGGYVVEVALKWTDITGNPNYVATAGKKFGTAVILVDNDVNDAFRDIIMSSNPGVTSQALFHQVTLDATGNYDKWIAGFAVGFNTGKSANPDGDAYTNEQEWILGSNPSVFTNESDFAPTLGVNAGLLEYTYDRRKNADKLGITYDVKVSLDLTNFDVVDPTYIPDPTPTSLNDEFEMVTDTVGLNAPRKFLKLNIEGPAE